MKGSLDGTSLGLGLGDRLVITAFSMIIVVIAFLVSFYVVSTVYRNIPV